GLSWQAQVRDSMPHASGWIWGDGAGHFYVAAYRMFHSLDGQTWSIENVVNDDHIIFVWGAGPNDVYALSDSKYAVYHSAGDGTWTSQSAPEPSINQQWVYLAVWGSGPNDLYAVGGGDFAMSGAIIHGDGAGHWTVLRDDVPPLYAIY